MPIYVEPDEKRVIGLGFAGKVAAIISIVVDLGPSNTSL